MPHSRWMRRVHLSVGLKIAQTGAWNVESAAHIGDVYQGKATKALNRRENISLCRLTLVLHIPGTRSLLLMCVGMKL